MRYLYTFLLIFSISFCAQAQQCLTDINVQQAIEKAPSLAERLRVQKQEIEAYINKYAKISAAPRYVPVVVHVLYTREEDNISEAQIKSGIEIMSLNFRAVTHAVQTVPVEFKPYVADVNVQFCLAAKDQWGNPTNGITRTELPANFDTNKDYYDNQKGGVRAWDPYRYLNIWVIDLPGGLLGFAWPPGVQDANGDGIVVDYRCIGSIDEAVGNSPHNLGITMVHEAGHYFGLSHLWGNTTGCSADDGVADTPPQYGPTGGCPRFPENDICNSTTEGIMFMNFMDYSNDGCLRMFTKGQKSVVDGVLFGPRSGFGSPTQCFPVSVNEVPAKHGSSIAPNPSRNNLYISSSSVLEEVVVTDMTGKAYLILTPNAKTCHLNISKLPAGIYMVKLNKNDVHKIVKR